LSKLAIIFKDRIQKAKKKDKKVNEDDDENYVPRRGTWIKFFK